MATLNMSLEGPSINKSYQSIVDAPRPSGPAAASATYGQWALYTVSAPLANAFAQSSNKESVLKVTSTGEGELADLIDDFSDGRIQFAFVKVLDPNTKLPKSVLIAWCGAGVPERTKGYFGSHLTTVSKLLHGYHVQVTARSENDVSPEAIIRKVADASGSKYSGDSAPSGSASNAPPPPPVASKPVFTPTAVGGGSRGFNPLAGGSRAPPAAAGRTDEDGWGEDAPQITRTQLEKVAPAYRPTKVNMADLTSQKAAPSQFAAPAAPSGGGADVVSGGYQPIGKVDIAAIRRQAQESGSARDDRPTAVKGSYEPVGKVDIAAIRARAQPAAANDAPPSRPAATGGSGGGEPQQQEQEPKSLADRSAAFTTSERLTSLPKPKVANRFGAGSSAFTGTKAPAPAGLGAGAVAAAAPVGTASKNFADQGGKTPAQIWAEKKARERGTSGAAETSRPGDGAAASTITSQSSGGGGWDGGYTGKKWAAVSTTKTGHSGGALSQQPTGEDVAREEGAGAGDAPGGGGGVSAMRDRFKGAAPMGVAAGGALGAAAAAAATHDDGEGDDDDDAPAPPMASRPVPAPRDVEATRLPTPPPQPRSPTPPTPPAVGGGSPILIAQPVGRVADIEPPEERFSPPPMPVQSLAAAVPPAAELEEEAQVQEDDVARSAGQAAAASTFGAGAAAVAPGPALGGRRALVQFDYEKDESNELQLVEGEMVHNIDMVDEDWWMGENSKGEKGLFPAAYVQLVDDDDGAPGAAPAAAAQGDDDDDAAAPPAPAGSKGPTATAEYDYAAAEDNELSFPENATITNLEFPDEDWWQGEYNGHVGLFPAAYVKLNE